MKGILLPIPSNKKRYILQLGTFVISFLLIHIEIEGKCGWTIWGEGGGGKEYVGSLENYWGTAPPPLFLRLWNNHLFGKELFIWFTVHVFRKRLLICVYASFAFRVESGMSDLIVLVPDHCPSLYFSLCIVVDSSTVICWTSILTF